MQEKANNIKESSDTHQNRLRNTDNEPVQTCES